MRLNKQLKKQDERTTYNPSFEEWLNLFSKEPTSKELDDMENEVRKNKPQNNPYYQPLRGA
ncbi:hypothetical protein OZZ08_01990 [Malaciobacter mytili]|uniref:hypothetical protein n=1 Tax=Malaciobacter mytili TaxID=603050 RepID=UPI003BB13557